MIGKNNPFNIRYSGRSSWKGLCGSTRGFCDFVDVAHAVRVVMYLFLKTYHRKGCSTLLDCISKYCPFGDDDNDPLIYTNIICRETGLKPYVSVGTLSVDLWYKVLSTMALIESNYVLSCYDFTKGFNLFKDESEE